MRPLKFAEFAEEFAERQPPYSAHLPSPTQQAATHAPRVPPQPDKSVRSNTSVCLSLADVDADGVKKMASLLESNGVALDIGKSDPT